MSRRGFSCSFERFLSLPPFVSGPASGARRVENDEAEIATRLRRMDPRHVSPSTLVSLSSNFSLYLNDRIASAGIPRERVSSVRENSCDGNEFFSSPADTSSDSSDVPRNRTLSISDDHNTIQSFEVIISRYFYAILSPFPSTFIVA